MKTIIKEQVQAQVSKIMPKIKKYVTESLGAEVLVRSTNQPHTSYAVAASLSESKLKKILIEKMKENQSVNGEGRDDQDKNKDPTHKESKSTSSSKEPTHKESKSTSSSKDASRSQPKSSGKSAHAEEHGQKVDDLEDQSHQEFNMGNSGSSSKKYTTSITKTKAADYGQVKWIEDKRFYGYASNMESSYDLYFRHMISGVTSLKIMKWFGHSHLKEIIVRRQDAKLYKFKEGDFKRLRRQDTEDMLLLLV
nr:hypothetical protein [Tanacetum cinerariifolium]